MKKKDGLFLLFIILAVIMLTVFLHFFVARDHSFSADFFTFWLAGKEMIIEGKSPYSEIVTHQSQMGIYGRTALPGEDQLAFAYPPYSLFVLFPVVRMDYAWAQAYWLAFNIVVLLTAVWFAFPRLPAFLAVAALFFYPASRGIIMGQFAVIVGSLAIFVYGLLVSKQHKSRFILILSGLILAWMTIKPQISFLLIFIFLLYSLRNRLWLVFWGFGLGWITLVVISSIWVPGWIFEWFTRILEYSKYVPFGSLARHYSAWVIPDQWLNISEILIYLLGFVLLAKLSWDWCSGRLSFLILIAFTVFLIQIIHPRNLPSEQIIFLLPLFIWLERDDLKYLPRIVLFSAVLIPWLVFVFSIVDKEPIIMTTLPPLLFVIWFLFILYRELAFKDKTQKTLTTNLESNEL